MADYKVTDTEMISVANAIRTKGGTSAQLEWPSEFISAIQAIPSGGGSILVEKNITQNGTYNASSDNADGYSKVVVNVSGGGGSTGFSRATSVVLSSIMTVLVSSKEVIV